MRCAVGVPGLEEYVKPPVEYLKWSSDWQQSDAPITGLYLISCHLWQSEQLVGVATKPLQEATFSRENKPNK